MSEKKYALNISAHLVELNKQPNTATSNNLQHILQHPRALAIGEAGPHTHLPTH